MLHLQAVWVRFNMKLTKYQHLHAASVSHLPCQGDLIDEAVEPWGVAGPSCSSANSCVSICWISSGDRFLGIWLTDRLVNSNMEM